MPAKLLFCVYINGNNELALIQQHLNRGLQHWLYYASSRYNRLGFIRNSCKDHLLTDRHTYTHTDLITTFKVTALDAMWRVILFSRLIRRFVEPIVAAAAALAADFGDDQCVKLAS